MAPAITVIVTRDCRISYVCAPTMVGDPTELIGLSVLDVLPRSLHGRIRSWHTQVFRHRLLVPLGFAVCLAGGARTRLEGRAGPLRQRGRVYAALVHLCVQSRQRSDEPSDGVRAIQLARERALADLIPILRSFDADVLHAIRARLLPHAVRGGLVGEAEPSPRGK